MSTKRIAVAADHAGYPLKDSLREELERQGHRVVDLGTNSTDSVDYPDFADKLAAVFAVGDVDVGLLVCGTGIGISIAANRHVGLRAALCHDTTSARLSRAHNDANVLALGARTTGIETARDILSTFLGTPFEGGRHARRVAKLTPPPDAEP